MLKKSIHVILTVILYCSFCVGVLADEALVEQTRSLSAKQFDKTLPEQSIDEWLRIHIPAEYEIVWGKYVTDCGEGTGSATHQESDIPSCAEIEIRKENTLVGYLALFVGSEDHGLSKDGSGLFFGYLEYKGTKYTFRKLSDILNVK